MTKNTKNTQQKITTWFGYGLFVLLVVGVVVSTIVPSLTVLFSPGVNQVNALVYLLTAAAGVVLPVLLAYVVGYKATRVQNKETRRYNGVLFGILAYWLAMIFAMFGSTIISATYQWLSASTMTVLVNVWPILATLVTVLIIGRLYAKKQSKASVLLYSPYTVSLWVAVGITGLVLPLSILLYPDNFYVTTVYVAIAFIVVAVISYLALIGKRLTVKEMGAQAIIATSIGFISLNVVSQLFPYEAGDISWTSPSSITFTVISAGIWIVYLAVVRRSVK